MYAISHAATALILKRRYPAAGWWGLLVAVQAVELLWVVFIYLGIEHVRYTSDFLHLDFLPYSHSIATGAVLALGAWLALPRQSGRRALGTAVALGILSHIVLDIIHHEPDIALWPSPQSPRIGLGLIDWPAANLLVEITYGVGCWLLFGGRRGLLIGILVANLLNIPLMFPRPGTGRILAAHPALLPTLILVQIVATWLLVWWLGKRPPHLPKGTASPISKVGGRVP